MEPRPPRPCEVGRPKGRRRKSRRQSHNDGPAKQWAATQPPQPVEPMPNDFMLAVNSSSGVVAKPLLPECQAYLQAAQNLINDVRRPCQQLHGSQKVTSPPNV